MFEVVVTVIEKEEGRTVTRYSQTYNGSDEVRLLRFAKHDIIKRIVSIQ